MEKLYTEEDLRDAFRAGQAFGADEMAESEGYNLENNPNSCENEWVKIFISQKLNKKIEEEEKFSFTLQYIKAKCGWDKFCDVTGYNHYALNEFSISESELFSITKSHAIELGFL